MAVLFTDTAFIKRFTPLNVSVEDLDVSAITYTAQEKNIKPYLGRELYDHIIGLIQAGTINQPSNSDYRYLLDNYVRMACAWWTVVEMMPILRVKISNGGLLTRTPAETSPASQTDIDSVRNMARQNSHHFTYELIRYLKDNRTRYPEYKCAETKVMSVAGYEIGSRLGWSWNQ